MHTGNQQVLRNEISLKKQRTASTLSHLGITYLNSPDNLEPTPPHYPHLDSIKWSDFKSAASRGEKYREAFVRMESPSRKIQPLPFFFLLACIAQSKEDLPGKRIRIDGPPSINRRGQWIRAQRARMHLPLPPVSRRNATNLAFLVVQVQENLAWSYPVRELHAGQARPFEEERVFEREAHRVNTRRKRRNRRRKTSGERKRETEKNRLVWVDASEGRG